MSAAAMKAVVVIVVSKTEVRLRLVVLAVEMAPEVEQNDFYGYQTPTMVAS